MIVMKFGGSSVADAQRIESVSAIVRGELKRKPVIVASAFRGVTDDLFSLAREALSGRLSGLPALRRRHEDAAAALGVDPHLLDRSFEDLSALLNGISLIKELTPRTLDAVVSFGEKFSTRLVTAAFVKAGLPAVQVDADKAGLLTDDRFGQASPLPEADVQLQEFFMGIIGVPVVTGYIGRTCSGDTTTLGRNGSDFSATILGAALSCDEVQIWSDTDGVMTADPRLVPTACPIASLSFDEACELAYYGGKVLHPHTLVPAMKRNIPVRVLNTFKPSHPGTLILANPPQQASMGGLKSIAFKRHQFIVSVSSPRMLTGYGFLARIFSVFSRHEIDVDMVSTSEVSVSATTGSEKNLQAAVAELGGEFETSVEPGMAVVCAVGDGIMSRPGVAAEIFSAVKDAGVNIRMISQGASRNNVTFVVADDDVKSAVSSLHRRFFEASTTTLRVAQPEPA